MLKNCRKISSNRKEEQDWKNFYQISRKKWYPRYHLKEFWLFDMNAKNFFDSEHLPKSSNFRFSIESLKSLVSFNKTEIYCLTSVNFCTISHSFKTSQIRTSVLKSSCYFWYFLWYSITTYLSFSYCSLSVWFLEIFDFRSS